MPASAKPFPRSEVAQDILSHRPSFLERWALLIFLGILVLVLTGASFIRYPDIVQASGMLTATNAPKEVVTHNDGKIQKMFVSNDEMVAKGQMIAWIESTADHQQVILLSLLLTRAQNLLQQDRTAESSALFLKQFQQLGELQSAYQDFINAWRQFNDYLVNGYYSQQEHILKQNFELLGKIHFNLEEENKLNKKDLLLVQEAFDATDSLYKDKVLSHQELRDQTSKLFGKQMSIPQMEASIFSNENQQADKQKEINELEHTISVQKGVFLQAMQTLKSKVDDWERRFIITAATSGRITFLYPLQQDQYVQTEKLIGYVNPTDTRYYAQITLPQANFGKVAIGQKVQLRLPSYPYPEYGFLEGRLDYISKIPSDSGYLATVGLPNGLATNYHLDVQYHTGLRFQAFIITRDQPLLQSFYYGIVKAVHDR